MQIAYVLHNKYQNIVLNDTMGSAPWSPTLLMVKSGGLSTHTLGRFTTTTQGWPLIPPFVSLNLISVIYII